MRILAASLSVLCSLRSLDAISREFTRVPTAFVSVSRSLSLQVTPSLVPSFPCLPLRMTLAKAPSLSPSGGGKKRCAAFGLSPRRHTTFQVHGGKTKGLTRGVQGCASTFRPQATIGAAAGVWQCSAQPDAPAHEQLVASIISASQNCLDGYSKHVTGM